jgi:integrase
MYRARPIATFSEFADKWEQDTLSQLKYSYQASEKSRLKRHLRPFFGSFRLKDMNGDVVQEFISNSELNAKTTRNCIATLRTIWNAAVAWKYIGKDQDWFDGITLPEWVKPESPSFTEDEMRDIIANANEPHRTFYWVLGETGMRLGECCGLKVSSLKLDLEMIVVRWSAWHGKMGSTKSKRPRVFSISPKLTARLREMIEPIKDTPDAFLFASKNKTPWIGDDVVRDHLKPLLLDLGIKTIPDGTDEEGQPKFKVIEGVGAHAFRHGNASLMDQKNVPIKVRQERIGHTDFEGLTIGVYTHAQSKDHREAARALGDLLVPDSARKLHGNKGKGPEARTLTLQIQ